MSVPFWNKSVAICAVISLKGQTFELWFRYLHFTGGLYLGVRVCVCVWQGFVCMLLWGTLLWTQPPFSGSQHSRQPSSLYWTLVQWMLSRPLFRQTLGLLSPGTSVPTLSHMLVLRINFLKYPKFWMIF